LLTAQCRENAACVTQPFGNKKLQRERCVVLWKQNKIKTQKALHQHPSEDQILIVPLVDFCPLGLKSVLQRQELHSRCVRWALSASEQGEH